MPAILSFALSKVSIHETLFFPLEVRFRFRFRVRVKVRIRNRVRIRLQF
jgi:hypothetical protein